MGDADHLVAIADAPELLADYMAGASANTYIYFVEHQRRHIVHARKDRLERQQQPRALAARGDPRQWLQRFTRVRREQELDLVDPSFVERPTTNDRRRRRVGCQQRRAFVV